MITPISLQLRGTFLVGLSGILFGLIGILGTKILDLSFTIENMLFWRFLIASLWILLICAICKKNIFQKNNTDISIVKTFIFAAISYSASSALYFVSSKQVGTGVGMVIFFSFPIFIALFTWVLNGWRVDKYALISVMAVTVGLLFLKGEGKQALNIFGIAMGLLAAIFYAIYVYGSQHSAKKLDALLLTLLVCVGNTIIFLILAWYNNSLFVPASLKAWSLIFVIGIFSTVLPIQFLLMGLKYISPMKASILSVSEPVVTLIVGLLFLDETLSLMQTIGIVIVILGALFIQFDKELVC